MNQKQNELNKINNELLQCVETKNKLNLNLNDYMIQNKNLETELLKNNSNIMDYKNENSRLRSEIEKLEKNILSKQIEFETVIKK